MEITFLPTATKTLTSSLKHSLFAKCCSINRSNYVSQNPTISPSPTLTPSLTHHLFSQSNSCTNYPLTQHNFPTTSHSCHHSSAVHPTAVPSIERFYILTSSPPATTSTIFTTNPPLLPI
mmetsp:Transcript_15118/g.20734  ORF Transcript_15118/g.20734 Transcript_15118/m.20734 type:complete len:120 (+) Transcript_15118:698-1057(+)